MCFGFDADGVLCFYVLDEEGFIINKIHPRDGAGREPPT